MDRFRAEGCRCPSRSSTSSGTRSTSTRSTAAAGPATPGTPSCSPTRSVPGRPARPRPRGVAQRAPGRGRARPRGVVRRDRGADGHRPRHRLPVAFDPTDPDFLEAYFEELHHPLEDEGVDFWWLDWQQGGVTKIARPRPAVAAQPLPLPRLRPRREAAADVLALRRHRQPPLPDRVLRRHRTSPGSRWTSSPPSPRRRRTPATAGGATTSAATSRATRTTSSPPAGCSSASSPPIMRLHSGLNPFNTREPWRFAPQSETVMTDFLRLRHQLLPYLATMNVRAHVTASRSCSRCTTTTPTSAAAYDVPQPVHVRHRAAGRADHLAGRPGDRPRPGHGRGCPRAPGSTSSPG